MYSLTDSRKRLNESFSLRIDVEKDWDDVSSEQVSARNMRGDWVVGIL